MRKIHQNQCEFKIQNKELATIAPIQYRFKGSHRNKKRGKKRNREGRNRERKGKKEEGSNGKSHQRLSIAIQAQSTVAVN